MQHCELVYMWITLYAFGNVHCCLKSSTKVQIHLGFNF